jgi:hypothetical protein
MEMEDKQDESNSWYTAVVSFAAIVADLWLLTSHDNGFLDIGVVAINSHDMFER